MVRHLDISIFGRVQGVFFRVSAKEIADNLGVKGYIKNEGRFVFVEAEGSDEALENFLEWCHRGPEGAKVENVEYRDGQNKLFDSFNII